MKKRILSLIFAVVMSLSPFLAIPCVLAGTGIQYGETYYAALSKQYDRLCAIDEPKVIVVGGSNVAFGLDSELFEELYGRPSVAFGLYGSFGVKVMMDWSKANVNSGDIVVLAPELSSDALSLYFGAEPVLKATEGRFDILSKIAFENVGDILGASWGFASTKIKNSRSDEGFDIEGVYRNSAVNEYGEIGKDLFPREGNILATGYLSEPVSYDPATISAEFIDYVNEYTAYCKSRGAAVYYSFSPVNGRAVNPLTMYEDTANYYMYLREKLDCEVISSPSDYIYDYRYFYDTNFHLNDSGVVLRTAQLVRDLKLVNGDTSPTVVELPAPPAPQYKQPNIDFTLPYTNADWFTYEEAEGGFLTITGVKEEVKALKEVIVPVVHDSKYVISLKAGAFKDCTNLETVTIPVGITEIDNAVFEGCSRLKKIRMLEKSEDNIAVFGDFLLGVPDDCKIVIVNATVSDFGTGYFWQWYANRLVKEE